jgi:hypothetical protein
VRRRTLPPELPVAFTKAPHKPGCTGNLYHPPRPEVLTVDRTGRRGNGGHVVHALRCNASYDGCPALVYVTVRAILTIARAHEVRR